MLSVFRTSEFWVGLVAAVLQFLVSKGYVSQTVGDFVQMAVVYVIARLLGKTAKAVLPEGK